MVSFERAFDEVENLADEAVKASRGLTRQLGRLVKASKEGNIAAMKREQSRLAEALKDLADPVNDAANAWPYDDEQEAQYFKDGYAAELRSVAAEKGLTIYERDGNLISSPSVVRLLARDKAVQIDRKRVSAIRPSHLAGVLLKTQRNPVRTTPQRFLNMLYQRYLAITRDLPTGMRRDPVIPLSSIYDHVTALPWVRRDYTPTEFARDLYQLDTSDIRTTRSGAVVSFPASTGTRSARNLFTFVGPDGHEIKYYGIRFTEG